MKKWIRTLVLALLFCIGLSFLLYPSVSNLWNRYHQSRAVARYAQAVSQIREEEYQSILESAVRFNEKIALSGGVGARLTEEEKKEYQAQLNVAGTGIMSYIEIPKIDCLLPIYHGTADSVLQVASGHTEGSSLPVGGEGTHCVIVGHRGLPSARLFTDIDQLEKGDEFCVHTLNEVLTYRVDQIRVVLPYEIQDLKIEPGEDLCTLVTCTPYGINTHRLLVRGKRIFPENGQARAVTADAVLIPSLRPALIITLVILAILFAFRLLRTKKRASGAKTHRREQNEKT